MDFEDENEIPKISLFKEFQLPGSSKQECDICKVNKSPSEMFKLPCPKNHTLCYDCWISMIEDQVTQYPIPYCQICWDDSHEQGNNVNNNNYIPGNMDTDYYLTYSDVRNIYCQGLSNSELWEQNKIRFDELYFKQAIKTYQVTCAHPSCGKKFIVQCKKIQRDKKVYFQRALNEEALCPYCKESTCPKCSDMFHYTITCDAYKEYKKEWQVWLNSDRFQRHYALMDVEEQKKHYAEAKKLFENEQKRCEENYKHEQEDELNLVQHAKYCPSCHRVILKVDGCDLMICGRNWHGGDQQDGCGANFKWSEAPLYKPSVIEKKIIVFNEKPVQVINKCQHDLMYKCGLCHKEIIGYRFKCLNCPCCYLCEDCDYQHAHDHFKGEHVFCIYKEDPIKE